MGGVGPGWEVLEGITEGAREVRKVLVVSDSPVLRETVDIVLGNEFSVEGRTTAEAPAALEGDVALVIVEGGLEGPRGNAPILHLGTVPVAARETRRRRRVLPADFDPLALREAAAALTAAGGLPLPAVASPLLGPPFLPPRQEAVAARAVATPLPLCLWGEAGSGKLRLARAIHLARGAAHFHPTAAAEVNRAEIRLTERAARDGEVTVVVSGLEELDAAGQRRLGEMLETRRILDAAGEPAPARIIVTARRDPAILARDGALDRHLFYQVGVLSLELPPLRSRAGEIPDLARAVAAGLCESLGLQTASFTESSLRRLRHYLWFGNLAELEAVLARSLVFAAGDVIDAGDLRFGYGARLETSAAPALAAAEGPRAASNGHALDLIIQELAHEFKNPLVTIKTFAHQLDHAGDPEGAPDEFARLTGEAVERMDAALENLVQYTRFDAPARQPTSLGAIVASALGGVEDVVGDKRIALEVEPTVAEVLVDPAQCTYALRNLLRAVVRDLSPGDRLAVRTPAAAALSIEYPARARLASSSLSRLVSGDGDGQDRLPLGFTFARSLVERNGGHIEFDRNGEVTRVRIEFLLVGEGRGDNGEAQDPGRR